MSNQPNVARLPITTRIDPNTSHFLEELAQSRGQSRSDVIRLAIAQYLETQKPLSYS
jgi:predicted transcriptional regulator